MYDRRSINQTWYAMNSVVVTRKIRWTNTLNVTPASKNRTHEMNGISRTQKHIAQINFLNSFHFLPDDVRYHKTSREESY